MSYSKRRRLAIHWFCITFINSLSWWFLPWFCPDLLQITFLDFISASKKPLPPTPEDNWVSAVRHAKLSLVSCEGCCSEEWGLAATLPVFPSKKAGKRTPCPQRQAGSFTLRTRPSLYLQQGLDTSYHYLLITLLYASNFPLIYCICKSNQVQHMSFLSLG